MMKHSCGIRLNRTEGLTWKRDKTLSNKSCQSLNPLNQGSDKKDKKNDNQTKHRIKKGGNKC
uniref:Uncharacterized protein n=1 Tax=Candidatus Magnetobacterium bavaricum TaxID=29290 RepID=D7GXE8_9BACT|nr:hypothetical protein mtbajb2F00027 [Candidatus Magnetobacterium bavaricum]